MKHPLTKIIRLCCASIAVVLITQSSFAQGGPPFTGHYPAGAEGIRAATLPPPGIYLRDYNILYYADKYEDGPADFNVTAYVNAPRVIWISNFELLGGNYGADVLLPMGYTDLEVNGLEDDHLSIGDVHVEPITLSWHKDRFDAAVGYAFWAPTGDFSPMHPARLAKGFWSHMATVGGTYYFDAEKTWAFSALNRYEIHHKHEDFNITPGHSYTLEWGLSKSIKTIDIGVVGYYQRQVTKDHGVGASDLKDRILGIGPEIAALCPKLGVITSLRYIREFAAKDRPEGNTFSLTLTKRF